MATHTLQPLEASFCPQEHHLPLDADPPIARPCQTTTEISLVHDPLGKLEITSIDGTQVHHIRIIEAEQGRVLEANIQMLSGNFPKNEPKKLVRSSHKYRLYTTQSVVCKVYGSSRVLEAYRELTFLTLLQHQHIVRLDDADLREATRPRLSLGETWSGLTLADDPYPKVRYALEAAEALAYVHAQCMIHRDVRPQSFWIVHDTLKLADFTNCRLFSGQTYDMRMPMTAMVGTFRYMSPECFRGERYSLKADVFGWALLAYGIAFNTQPYQHSIEDHAQCHYETHARPTITFKSPQAAKFAPILKMAWSENHTERPTFDELLPMLRQCVRGSAGKHAASTPAPLMPLTKQLATMRFFTTRKST